MNDLKSLNIVFFATDDILDYIQRLQKKYSKSFINNVVVPILLQGERELTEIEELFVGIRKDEKWYALLKRTYSSLGPRLGNFLENVVEYLVKQRKDVIYVARNKRLTEYLKERFGIEIKEGQKRKIDFIIEEADKVSFIELRTSEHTGGKTGQESLMDKLTMVLKWLEKYNLREVMLMNSKEKIELIIAIVYTESHRLLGVQDFSKGRLASLVDYIADERHVGGIVKRLISKYGYSIIEESGVNDLIKTLIAERKFTLTKENFTVEFKILSGEEFFKTIIKKKYADVMEELRKKVATDLKVFIKACLKVALSDNGEIKLRKALNTCSKYANALLNRRFDNYHDYLKYLREILYKCSKENNLCREDMEICTLALAIKFNELKTA